MVRPAAGDADAERRDLGAVDIDPGGAGAARGASAQEIDHRLFEQAHEGFDLQPAACEIDQRIEHHLAGAVVGDLATTVGSNHRDSVGHADGRGALA